MENKDRVDQETSAPLNATKKVWQTPIVIVSELDDTNANNQFNTVDHLVYNLPFGNRAS